MKIHQLATGACVLVTLIFQNPICLATFVTEPKFTRIGLIDQEFAIVDNGLTVFSVGNTGV